jgi:ABA sandwich protein
VKAGLELDALIGTKVMGWKILSHWEPGVIKHLNDENQHEVIPPEFKPYSTDIAAAWEIMELPIFDSWMIGKNANGQWQVWNPYEQVVVSTGDTAPHAICLAALKGSILKGEKP